MYTHARANLCYTYRCHFPMSHRQERSRRGQHSKRATMFFSYIPETQHKPKFSSLSMDRGGRHVRTSQMYNYNMLRSGIMFLWNNQPIVSMKQHCYVGTFFVSQFETLEFLLLLFFLFHRRRNYGNVLLMKES